MNCDRFRLFSCMILRKTTFMNMSQIQIAVVPFMISRKVTTFRNCHRFLLFSFRKTTKFMNYHSFLLFSFMILEKLQSSKFKDFYCFVVILRKVNHEYVTVSDCCCPFYDPKKSYKVRELPQISVVF